MFTFKKWSIRIAFLHLNLVLNTDLVPNITGRLLVDHSNRLAQEVVLSYLRQLLLFVVADYVVSATVAGFRPGSFRLKYFLPFGNYISSVTFSLEVVFI